MWDLELRTSVMRCRVITNHYVNLHEIEDSTQKRELKSIHLAICQHCISFALQKLMSHTVVIMHSSQ